MKAGREEAEDTGLGPEDGEGLVETRTSIDTVRSIVRVCVPINYEGSVN